MEHSGKSILGHSGIELYIINRNVENDELNSHQYDNLHEVDQLPESQKLPKSHTKNR